MDWAAWGLETLDWKFFAGVINIVIIDIILAGDNAVVIAMAVRSLPRKQRQWGIMLGAGAAVLLRVVLTFFVAKLLNIEFIKLAGGVLIAWIAVKLFIEGSPEQADKEAKTLLQAMWLIVVADITMSTDNVLAVAGASHGNAFLLLFGLALSIPFVVFTSNLLAMLMDRYPIIIYIGAAILGRVAAEMIFTDPFVERWLSLPTWFKYAMEVLFAFGVIGVGKLWLWYTFRKAEKAASAPVATVPTGHFGGGVNMAILTISREYGSGGREIGRRVAERLKYEYVDKERLFLDLDRQGKRWGQAARELDEVCPTFWERHDWQYHGYITLLESLIFQYAAADKVVIIGRGAFLLLQDVPFCLKVRLVAPPEVRLERIMVQESLDREAARGTYGPGGPGPGLLPAGQL